MNATIHIDMTAVWEVAEQVTVAAATLSRTAMQLHIRHYSPATDTYTLTLCQHVNATKSRLAVFAESAAAELVRIVQALLYYTDNAAVLSRRTELAVMGLAIEPFQLLIDELSCPPPHRIATYEEVPTTDLPEHRILSEALLLHATALSITEPDPRVTRRLHAAAGHLDTAASQLHAALPVAGDRPAAMLIRFSAWVRDDLLTAVNRLNDSLVAWATAYQIARGRVADSAAHYQRWLASAASGASNQQTARLSEEAARVRAAIDEYRHTEADFAIACRPHPRLTYPATTHPAIVT